VLSKLYEVLYHKVFVNIVVGRSQSIVYIEECNSNGVVSSDSKSFDTTTLNTQMYEYINLAIITSPFYYISILDTSETQGVIPTCSTRNIPTFCDLDMIKYICYQDKWAFYTSKLELDKLQNNYKKIGLDFIFSPFVILRNFFKDKIDNYLAIYILIEENNITLSVFDNSSLLYGDYIDIQQSSEYEELLLDEVEEEEVDLDLDNSIDLDDIDAMDDIDGLDDFGDIEDLDSIDEIDEFAESEDEEEKFMDEVDKPAVESTDGLNEDYNRFSLIQSSINRFYKGSIYESKFVESAYIADAAGMSGDLKRYLEEEMFLSVFMRQIDLNGEVCEVAKAEIK